MVRKHTFSLIATTLLSASAVISVSSAHAHNTSSIFIPCLTPGYELSLSALYLQPHADNLGWGAVTTVLPIPTPNWHIQTIKPNYELGFKLGGRYIIPCSGNDVQLSWSHLHTSASNSVSVDPASQWISPFSQTGTPPTFDAITGVAKLKVGRARASFNYDVVNLDGGQFINFGPCMQMRIFSGISGVRIKESINSSFHGLPQPVLTLNNTSSFSGIGPRLGVNNTFGMFRGFNLVCELAGSLLAGHMRPAQYKFTGTSDALVLVGIDKNHEEISSSRVTHIVSALDTKLGINYMFDMPKCSQLTVEFGYAAALYINPLSSYETNTNVIALDTGSLSTSSVKHTLSNFSVGGLYLTGSWKF